MQLIVRVILVIYYEEIVDLQCRQKGGNSRDACLIERIRSYWSNLGEEIMMFCIQVVLLGMENKVEFISFSDRLVVSISYIFLVIFQVFVLGCCIIFV